LNGTLELLVYADVNTGAPETPNSFQNLKTSLLAMWHFCTNSHHAQWCLEFS